MRVVSMTKGNSKTHTRYGIYLYALLLLSNIKWEVAYSTLCTEKIRKLYINLHTAGLLLRQAPSDTTRTRCTRKLLKRTSIKSGRTSTQTAAISPVISESHTRCLQFVIIRDVINHRLLEESCDCVSNRQRKKNTITSLQFQEVITLFLVNHGSRTRH